MDIATRLKQFAEDQQWGNVYLGSRSDIVDRPDSEQNVEESLVLIENALPNKVDGKHMIYKDLSALGLTNSNTVQDICSAMAANSTITYANTGNGTAYPTTNGTVVINKVTNEYCILMYNDVQTNSIYTGVFYKSASLGSPRWSGWKTYAGPLEFDASATQDSTKLLSSGTIYSIQQTLITQIQEMSNNLTQEINTVDGRVDTVSGNLTSHTGDKTIHITSAERQAWNAKQDKITDDNGVVLAQYLPSYVDDVIEGTYRSATRFDRDGSPVTLEKDKIYLDINTNKVYRYGGSALVEIPLGVALGETSSTAYRGDRGKIAYDHSQTATTRQNDTGATSLVNGGTFVAVTDVRDASGHVIGTTATTYTLPTIASGNKTASSTGQPSGLAEGDLWFETIT